MNIIDHRVLDWIVVHVFLLTRTTHEIFSSGFLIMLRLVHAYNTQGLFFLKFVLKSLCRDREMP